MPDPAALHDSLSSIAAQLTDDMSERDVENLFLERGFYDALDYEGTGVDIRSEFTLPDDRRPDYITLDANERVTAVYEFKTSGRDLAPHTDQLFGYMEELRAEYGVLTNGALLELYSRESSRPILEVHLESSSESDARDLASALGKPEWDITDPSSVNEYIQALDPVPVEGDLGQAHFFDTFRLEAGSPFANMVTALMDLLRELRDEQDAKFVSGAYDFWEASYASEPDDVPNSWDDFIGSQQELSDFMFCLESGHALLARLLLAKACEDRDFFPANTGIREYFRELQGFGRSIDLDAYPVAANGLMEDMRTHLVESLFEDDIFIWWTDGYQEETASLHADPYSRFRDVAQEGSRIERVSPATRERFSRAVAHVFFATLKFDLSAIEGDPLGDLYQHYFDPETRKALGEFYTPQEVIEYIMDGVEYDIGVSNERLIDPACGSGTFLVEAVERYLEDVRRYDDDPDWAYHLTNLCSRPDIVGLDIHPFAVLMAQIRFMITILPEYREAKLDQPDFTLRRLPIFRTDSLRNERESTGIDLGEEGERQLTWDALTEDSQDVLIPVPLPVEVDADDGAEREGDFLIQRVRMPLFDTIQLETGVSNFGEYFAALQGVLDVVKFHMREDMWEYSGGLQQGINRYTTREYDGIEEFFAPYVDDILGTVHYLREEHGDGRLFKMFEDSVLALVVKNYMDYEYVVGNPPYVRIQNLPERQREYFDELYESATGNYDIYCPFYERGLDWLSVGTGRLGYISPNQFMVTEYGEGLRRLMIRESRIEEVYDFRDSGVFEDATNYPAIVILADEEGEEERTQNQIRCVRVKSNVDEDSGRALDEAIIQAVRDHRDHPGYSDQYIDVFDFPQSELDDGYWSLMPPDELAVFNKLDAEASARIEDVTDAVFQGVRTSANTIYVVDVIDADRVDSDDAGETVTIVPSGGTTEYHLETDLLRPFLQGSDVKRWRGEWTGQHIIFPYHVEEGDNGDRHATLYSEDELREELPLTWAYFEEYEDELRARERGTWEDSEVWWEFGRTQNLEKFELPKAIQAEIANHATFMLDESGSWYFTTAYGISVIEAQRGITNELVCQLNSKALDYYLKHIAVIKAGGYYSYRTQYVEKLPCITGDFEVEFRDLREAISEIVNSIDLDSKTHRFPEAYLGEFSGELEYIDYEWQTRRYPVDAKIQELADGRMEVQAGRSDSITNPRMESPNRQQAIKRAEYVLAAVDGRNVKSGEEQTIPIPRRDEDVESLLEQLEADRAEVSATDIDALEADIDEAVYDMFELNQEEREVIEDYLDVF